MKLAGESLAYGYLVALIIIVKLYEVDVLIDAMLAELTFEISSRHFAKVNY